MKKIILGLVIGIVLSAGIAHAYTIFYPDTLTQVGANTLYRIQDKDNPNVICYIVARPVGDGAISCLNLPKTPVTTF